jgi:hypothetical protein
MRMAFYQVATVSRVQSTTRYDSTKCQLIETVAEIMEDDMRVVFYLSQIHTKSNPVRARTFPTNSGVVLERSSADDPTHEGCFGERLVYVSHCAMGAIAVGAQEVNNRER